MSHEKKRRHFTGQEKVTILRRHLMDKVPVSQLCEEQRIQPTLLYGWQKNLGTSEKQFSEVPLTENQLRVLLRSFGDYLGARDRDKAESSLTIRDVGRVANPPPYRRWGGALIFVVHFISSVGFSVFRRHLREPRMLLRVYWRMVRAHRRKGMSLPGNENCKNKAI